MSITKISVEEDNDNIIIRILMLTVDNIILIFYYIIIDYISIGVLLMNIDFTKILQNSQSSDLEPRDIFMSLPGKDKKYEYPRDVQSDVWKKWFECRKNKNNIIK